MVRATESTPTDVGETSLVKLLDLMTNRYHVGIVRAGGGDAGAETLYVDMPVTARLWEGQRVRYIVADGHGLVEKRAMRRACVTHVLAEGAARVYARLEAVAESALN